MIVDPVIAAAGLAELSPEESELLEQKLILAYSIPFALWSISYLVFLIVFFRNPLRRLQTNARAVLALFVLWATIGCALLVPTLPFLLARVLRFFSEAQGLP